ncbi:MAG: hypothetical protein EXS09_01560 [Gemmataceae bacterium]|nr:hypothetical protein [Gemmataceae bacterium]
MTRNLRREAPRVRLFAESLENREGPSSLTDLLALIISFPVCADVRPVDNPAPVALLGSPFITDADGTSGVSGSATVSGNAIDDKSLAGCLVTIRGDGVSETAIIDAKGTFSITFQRPTNADFVVKVIVVDNDGNASAPVMVLVSGI